MLKRGEKVEELEFKLGNLKAKFNLFPLVAVLVILVILSTLPSFDPNLIGLSLVGLLMIVMVSRTLSSSIYRAFVQIKDFARELPRGRKLHFP